MHRLHVALARGKKNETGGSSWGEGATAAESSCQQAVMRPLSPPF